MLYVFSSYTSEIIKSWNCPKTLGIACLWQSDFFCLVLFFFNRKGIVTWWKNLRLWRDTKPRFKSSFTTFSWAIWEHTLTSLTMNCSSVNQLYNTLILYDWRLEATCIKYCLLRVYLCLPARMVLAEWEPSLCDKHQAEIYRHFLHVPVSLWGLIFIPDQAWGPEEARWHLYHGSKVIQAGNGSAVSLWHESPALSHV